jgi:class 3 adenylate cyclase/pimeloyl-ACP methyl ester carboxylesterase
MATTATVTVLFCDVVGSTERLSRLGDDAGDEFRRSLFARLRACVDDAGGREVKNLGDGLMVVFQRSAIDALVCAQAMHREAAALDATDPVQLRIGLSVGEVAEEDGDWFGTPVVEAARLCAVAGPEQTLATSLVRTLVGSRGHHRFRDVGPLQLKGLPAPVSVTEVDGLAVDEDTALALSVLPVPSAQGDRPVGGGPADDGPRRWGRILGAAVAGVAVAALVVFGVAVSRGRGDGDPGDAGRAAAPVSDAVTRPEGYRPSFRPGDCPPEVSSAVPAAECGDLVVPESRANPDGRTLQVPVVKRPATRQTGAAPVVLVDVNEPIATTSLADAADVYSLSLRGFSAGGDPPLACDGLRNVWTDSFALRADDPVAVERRVTSADACAAELRAAGAQLEGYNMAEVADDIRDLVLARDLGRVTVAGGGFTTTAVASFARANPGAVGAVLLTNPVEPGRSPLQDPAAAVSKAFGRVADLCAADAGCGARFPDLAAQYRSRFSQLQAVPAPVVTNSLIGTGPYNVLLDGRRLAAALEGALAQSSRLGLVPTGIVGASNELTAAAGIDEDVKRYVAPTALGAAYLSYLCSYDANPNRTAEISATAMPEFAGANEATFARLCEGWGVPSVYDELARPLVGDVPVFLAQGSLSVAGSNDWAGAMAAQLDQATVARFPTMSEDLAFSAPPCLRELRREFARDPTRRPDVAACEKQSPPIEFSGVP